MDNIESQTERYVLLYTHGDLTISRLYSLWVKTLSKGYKVILFLIPHISD